MRRSATFVSVRWYRARCLAKPQKQPLVRFDGLPVEGRAKQRLMGEALKNWPSHLVASIYLSPSSVMF